MKYGLVRRDIGKKVPANADELLDFFRKELLDSYRQCREVVNRLTDDIDSGFVQLGDVIIREVPAPADLPAGDPIGSLGITQSGVYFWNGSAWLFLGPLSAAGLVVTEVAFGQASAVGTSTKYAREDHTHGTPATPVTSLASADGTVDVSSATGAVDVGLADGVIEDTNFLLQQIWLLCRQLVLIEMGQSPEAGAV